MLDISRPRLPKVTNLKPAPESSYSLREGIRRVLQNEWLVVVLLFLTASTVRWLFHLQHPRANGFLIYQGAPISDGSTYTFKAISIAEGHGIPPFQQPGIRPFYPITLACLYTWSGFSLQAIAILNIVIAGFTASLIYLCGARALNRFCGLGAGLFFAIDPTQLNQTAQAGTEPLGLLFFVASVYAILRGFQNQRFSIFFLSGLFIGLSNLTRTLTIFTLPFYLAVILIIGARERRLKTSLVRISAMILGFAMVIGPWLIRQERLYGIASISDNIGEAFYAASSPRYKQWTPAVRRDADNDGIPNTIGDRYRYFMHRAGENVIRNPGFYFRNVSASLWEYGNTFGFHNRASSRYLESYSEARKSQRLLFVYLLSLIVFIWVLRREKPFARSSLLYLFASLGLFLCFLILPVWLAFIPIFGGVIFSWQAGRRLPALILFGSLVMSVIGSAAFANPTLFRSILMTDWLFLFYVLAALSFAAVSLSKRFAFMEDAFWSVPTDGSEPGTPFQSALHRSSLRAIKLVITLLVLFFAVSGVRLTALTISNPKARVERTLTEWERNAIVDRLQQRPLAVLPQGTEKPAIRNDWSNPFGVQAGQLVMEVQRFPYDYYIPALQLPPRSRPAVRQPYAQTLIIVSKFDFIIPGEIPANFTNRPLIFVGVVSALEDKDGKRMSRVQVDGLAIIPFDGQQRPDFANAVCAPSKTGGG
jgi:4-amino-4-deoxy-L-arabinose transferase-like glycosyltransferase